MASFDEYDDDVSLAFVAAKSSKIAVEKSSNSSERNVRNDNLSQKSNFEKKSQITPKVKAENYPDGKDGKSKGKGAKKEVQSPDWRDIDEVFRKESLAQRKPKSLIDKAQDNAPTLFFIGMVVFVVGCR